MGCFLPFFRDAYGKEGVRPSASCFAIVNRVESNVTFLYCLLWDLLYYSIRLRFRGMGVFIRFRCTIRSSRTLTILAVSYATVGSCRARGRVGDMLRVFLDRVRFLRKDIEIVQSTYGGNNREVAGDKNIPLLGTDGDVSGPTISLSASKFRVVYYRCKRRPFARLVVKGVRRVDSRASVVFFGDRVSTLVGRK